MSKPVCFWCGARATTQVESEPTKFKDKKIVTPAKRAPACRACAKRLRAAAPTPIVRRPRRPPASQMTIDDFL